MSLESADPELYELCKQEKLRQKCGLEMIASENFASEAVLQALSSSFHNKYSEGQVNARYYGGNEIVDKMELLCQQRALALYGLNPEEWGVCVQPYSGSPANFAVFTALVGCHGRIMGLALADGGHLTHGFQAPSGKKVSATSLFFESMQYRVNKQTGLIDYNELETSAKLFRPKLIIAGTSAYSRYLDYAKFRKIATSVKALLMADMAHISGLVAAGLHPSPFEYCDVVTTTTHKTLRGPRGAMIFYRLVERQPTGKENVSNGVLVPKKLDIGQKICEAVFPGLQGGPHNNTIAGIAVALHEAAQPEFKLYQQVVVKNMQTLCSRLASHGYSLVTGGSETHVVLVDLRPSNIEGADVETLLEAIAIATNKNTVPGDVSAMKPGGIRLGTAALTSRGFTEDNLIKVADFIHLGIQLAKEAKAMCNIKAGAFKDIIYGDNEVGAKVKDVREQVIQFASAFPIPGFTNF